MIEKYKQKLAVLTLQRDEQVNRYNQSFVCDEHVETLSTSILEQKIDSLTEQIKIIDQVLCDFEKLALGER